MQCFGTIGANTFYFSPTTGTSSTYTFRQYTPAMQRMADLPLTPHPEEAGVYYVTPEYTHLGKHLFRVMDGVVPVMTGTIIVIENFTSAPSVHVPK